MMDDFLLDLNCDRQNCNLRLGVSQAFKSNSKKRKIRLKNHGKDFFQSIFTSPNGSKMLNKCRIGTQEQYPDVINGKRKILVTLPPQFTYDKRIKATSSVDEMVIENKVNDKVCKNEKELRDIKAFRSIYLPQAGERDIYGPLLGCFFKHPGLFINGFEPNKYLDVFIELAETYRRMEMSKSARLKAKEWTKYVMNDISNADSKYQGNAIKKSLNKLENELVTINAVKQTKNRFKDQRKYATEEIEALICSSLKSSTHNDVTGIPFTFHELEENILECLGRDVGEITKRTERLLKHIKCQKTNSGVKRSDIISAIEADEIGSRNFKNKTKSKFKSHEYYSEEEVRNHVMMSMYEDIVKLPGEWDFLLMLSDMKLLFNVEVKKQIDLESRKKCNLNESLNSASHQTIEHADYASNVFSPLLSEGWNFIKVACILPGQLDYDKICPHCRQFVIVGDTQEKIEKGFLELKLLVTKHFASNSEQWRQDFVNIFEAVVGLSSLSRMATTVLGKSNSWRQIQGNNADVISLAAGWTGSDLELDFKQADLTFKMIIDEPHNLNKLLYFNPEVIKVLANNLSRVIFACDFGSGIHFSRRFIFEFELVKYP